MTNNDTTRCILVAGTGPVGLLASLAFADAGFRVMLAGPPARADDSRTTALMVPALMVLGRLGVLDALSKDAATLKVIRIVDSTERLIRSPIVTFSSGEIGEDHFGFSFQNRSLNTVLEQAVSAHNGIEWHRSLVRNWCLEAYKVVASLSDGTTVTSLLAVAADGHASPARTAAGISTMSLALPQSALVLNFSHTRDHDFTSTEFYTETGLFTVVPLPGRRSSLVWVLRTETVQEFSDLDNTALALRIEHQMQSMLGRVTIDSDRQIYPLSTLLPTRFAGNRIAMVGEAAHVFPPIGAQGLNIGIRDVDQLIMIAMKHVTDPGVPSALRDYNAARWPDILACTSAVNLLNMSLLSDMLPAHLARYLSLSMLDGFSHIRAFFMREGLRPGSGFSAIASSLRTVRRASASSE